MYNGLAKNGISFTKHPGKTLSNLSSITSEMRSSLQEKNLLPPKEFAPRGSKFLGGSIFFPLRAVPIIKARNDTLC